MTSYRTGNREEWREARLDLLRAEKELTRLGDAVARQRTALPWVRIDKDYSFETEEGAKSLTELFGGRSQLIVYHFMFGQDYQSGCPSCSAIADSFNGIRVHLENHDVGFWAMSRAPLAKLLAYRTRMGWDFPWGSSLASDFNFDFGVSFTKEQQRDGLEFNFQREPPVPDAFIGDATIPSRTTADGAAVGAALTGTDVATYARERPGMSSFAMEDGILYHCYSTYGRGVDALWNAYRWLDRAPKGRNETGNWWQRHDEY